ncbi:MAG: tRNA (adenosine(37)-N6)-dimethylallyltransferase MiaA [Alphaproteobacteria bacterium]|nr:tRNA (adenosine(37)-N6)-dimethylallyltransferase MiaA [Alphaproteobacteria bacterium]
MANAALIITGPTASGKSRLAMDVAAKFNGVVVNADSMQIYRELRILTARPTADDGSRVPHELYGIASAAERFSVGAWRDRAAGRIEALADAGKLPIFCGGTGLYLKSLVDGLAPIPAIPSDVQERTRDLFDRLGGPAFHARLAERDPAAAARIRPQDGQRLRRAWDVLEATGRSIVAWRKATPRSRSDTDFRTILVTPPRAELYAACDARFDAMIATGAVDEVAGLAAMALDDGLPAMKALGVKDLRRYVAGEVDLDTAVAEAKKSTRRFAKRQLTWFRHQLEPDLVINEQYSESLQPKIFSFIREFLLTMDR